LDSLLWQVIRSREARRTSFHSRSNSTGFASIEDSVTSSNSNNLASWADLSGICAAMECDNHDIGSNFSDFYCSAASRSSPRTPRSEWGLSDSSCSSPVSESPNLRGGLLVTADPHLKEALYPSSRSPRGTALSERLEDSNPPHTLTLSKNENDNQVNAWKWGNLASAKRARSLVEAEDFKALTEDMVWGISRPPKKRRNLEPTRIRPSLSLPLGNVLRNCSFARGPASLRRALSLRSEVNTLVRPDKACSSLIELEASLTHPPGELPPNEHCLSCE
jgi:hypothetical protein